MPVPQGWWYGDGTSGRKLIGGTGPAGTWNPLCDLGAQGGGQSSASYAAEPSADLCSGAAWQPCSGCGHQTGSGQLGGAWDVSGQWWLDDGW